MANSLLIDEKITFPPHSTAQKIKISTRSLGKYFKGQIQLRLLAAEGAKIENEAETHLYLKEKIREGFYSQ